ncbi:MAG: ATP-binding protein, partial [Bacteroidales bacterium]|nr:ATP-binding protein [Bacteroidales bacterium]
ALYNNLEPGDYNFEVKASNSDGFWNEKSTTLQISITPPFYKTLLFKFLSIIFALFAIYLIIIARTHQIKKQNKLLDRLVRERTEELHTKNEELNVQKEELYDINSLLEERQQRVEEQSEKLSTQANELTKQRDKLKETNAAKDKLFSIIAHDLKNPLNTISGLTELIVLKGDNYEKDKILKLIRAMYTSILKFQKLLENLLQWSRTQIGGIKFSPKRVDISVLVENIIQMIIKTAEQKGNTIKVNIEPQLMAYADEDMLELILRNLLTNAQKYTQNGMIGIQANNTDTHTQIIVEDTGVGMDAEQLKLLFRIDKSNSTPGTDGEEGTGLGLIICKEFIDYHKGTIHVESTEDKGTKFKISLPLLIDE